MIVKMLGMVGLSLVSLVYLKKMQNCWHPWMGRANRGERVIG